MLLFIVFVHFLYRRTINEHKRNAKVRQDKAFLLAAFHPVCDIEFAVLHTLLDLMYWLKAVVTGPGKILNLISPGWHW